MIQSLLKVQIFRRIKKSRILAQNNKVKTVKKLNRIYSMKTIKMSIENQSLGKKFQVKISMKMMKNLIFSSKKNNSEASGSIKIIRKIIMKITININKIMTTKEIQSKMHINTLLKVNRITLNQQNSRKDQKSSLKEFFSINNNNHLASKADKKNLSNIHKWHFKHQVVSLKIENHTNPFLTREVNRVLKN